jgi:DNA-binding transcriptional ArsR family regulator
MSGDKMLDTLSDSCETVYVNEPMVQSIRENQIDESEILDLSELFKALSDPTRLKMIHALKQSELCVCDLSAVLQMGQSAVSHQLRYLRNLRLVKRRKEGKMMFYSLEDDHIKTLFTQGLNHIEHK